MLVALQLVAVGGWSEEDVRAMWREAARYEPRMSADPSSRGGNHGIARDRAGELLGTVDAEGAEAQFEDGVLTITLPKADIARPKVIPVRGASPRQDPQGETRATDVEIHTADSSLESRG